MRRVCRHVIFGLDVTCDLKVFSHCPQLGVFAWYAWGAGGVAAAAGPVPVDSPLVYRPDRRRELWRFLTYSVVHAGWLHLAFNLLVQLAVSVYE